MAIRRRLTSKTDEELAVILAPAHNKESTVSTFEALGIEEKHRFSFQRSMAWSGDLPDPRQMPVADLLDMVRQCPNDNPKEQAYRNRVKSPLTAIRAQCIMCTETRNQIIECARIECSLWPFRLGKNPFYGRRKPK